MDRGAYKVISTIIIMFTFIICVDELKACPSQGKGYHRRGLIVQIEIKLAILQADL